MNINPEHLTIDRSDSTVIRVRDDEGECICSFAANGLWEDHHILHTLKMAWQSYNEGLKDGAEEGKAAIRRALGISS